ncbi:MAG: TIM barrel protein, partial [Candidatus Latescibacteria bacterium]|nr:TIM barrel protein [Candidatus Latescibacterota bacterium]
MRLGIGFSHENFTVENLLYARQLGVTDVIVHGPRLGDNGVLEYDELVQVKRMATEQGLRLAAIENLPRDHWHDVLHAGSDRDNQIENVCQTIRNMGRAEIPILGYYFSIVGVWGHWRSYRSGGGRGGSGVKSFDLAKVTDQAPLASGPVTVEEMWSRLAYFLERVVPVAEESGVKLAAHQDDPPAGYLRGVGRLLTNHENMQRLIDLVPSPNNGLEFCQGTVAEMGIDGVIEAIHRFGAQKKIFYVHFRNVKGQFPKFDEVFADEGDVNMFEAMKAYRSVGFDG